MTTLKDDSCIYSIFKSHKAFKIYVKFYNYDTNYNHKGYSLYSLKKQVHNDAHVMLFDDFYKKFSQECPAAQMLMSIILSDIYCKKTVCDIMDIILKLYGYDVVSTVDYVLENPFLGMDTFKCLETLPSRPKKERPKLKINIDLANKNKCFAAADKTKNYYCMNSAWLSMFVKLPPNEKIAFLMEILSYATTLDYPLIKHVAMITQIDFFCDINLDLILLGMDPYKKQTFYNRLKRYDGNSLFQCYLENSMMYDIQIFFEFINKFNTVSTFMFKDQIIKGILKMSRQNNISPKPVYMLQYVNKKIYKL
ncbi:hypothetical protein nvc1_008 [Namao virus]|nr:hypothetical protein nvc1_008 [Namao virus]